jgi:molecular chaperone DnaK
MVYNVEKMLKDGGEKVDASDKTEVETALADAKTALTGDPNTSDLNAAREKLTTASHKLAEALYKAKAAAPAGDAPTDGDAAAAGTADEAKKDEGVIDAEYVDAEK